MNEHKLKNNCVVATNDGVEAKCLCGWRSSGHFSGMGASAAFQGHLEDVERILAFDKQET